MSKPKQTNSEEQPAVWFAQLASSSANPAPNSVGTPPERPGLLVNDVHARLSPTRVRRKDVVRSEDDVIAAVNVAREKDEVMLASGGLHSMGAQAFGRDVVMLDVCENAAVHRFDSSRGRITVGAGIMWPELLSFLSDEQTGDPAPWGIRQKQTGADRLTIGGALSANAHGRGLRYGPMVDDVESFVLIDAEARRRVCSRHQNRELFGLAIGGYGLFGIITEVTLRLRRRRHVRRDVALLDVEGLPEAFERQIGLGYEYGDFQFSIDPESKDFLRRGVFACYRPVPDRVPVTENGRALSDQDFSELLFLAHVNKSEAFARYADHYLASSGQIYDTDTHQRATYPENYHREIDARLGCTGSEMITELYVPRGRLPGFMKAAARDFREHGTDVIYGTVRLIEKDSTTFLPWAKERYACVIFNLHVDHTERGKARAADAFRRLIDCAIERQGSYYLTYHRYATKEQVLACHPRFPEFLRKKKEWDPKERFQSEWYRHYRRMFAG